MWKQFVVNWNGASFSLCSAWEESECLELHTNASGALRYGGFFRGKWFQGKWEPHQQLGQPEISIARQELFAIVVACHIWGESLQNKRIILNCDNESVVNIVNSKRSRISRAMDLLRHLTLLTLLKYNIYISAKHIPGKYNEIADSLSRFQFQRFQLLAPQADVIPHRIPVLLLKI